MNVRFDPMHLFMSMADMVLKMQPCQTIVSVGCAELRYGSVAAEAME